MIVCVSSFCRGEWDASSGPCAHAREGEGSYDEEHRRGPSRSLSSLMMSSVASRAEEHDDKDNRGARLSLSNGQHHWSPCRLCFNALR